MGTTNALLRASAAVVPPQICSFLGTRFVWRLSLSRAACARRYCPFTTRCSLQPPDVPLLAKAACISLTPKEVEDFAPKIRQVVDWFGQLQAIDLESVEPTLRADTEVGDNSRPDSPEIFENRDAILAGVPSYEEPFIIVPRVLNKE